MEYLRLRKNNISEILKDIKEKLEKTKQVSKLKIDINDYLPKQKEIEKPKIYFNNDVYDKMFSLVMQSDVEISWHMLVRREGNTYFVYDIILFPQINGATSTTTDQDEYAKWLIELMGNKDIVFEDIRAHGHSHVNMDVYSSVVDDKYQEDLLNTVNDGDYYIFFILNKKREICILLYDYKNNILFKTKDIDVIVTDSNGNDIKEWADEQISENCKKPGYTGRQCFRSNTQPKYIAPETKDSQLALDEMEDYNDLILNATGHRRTRYGLK